MNRVKNFIYKKALKTLYFALIHSHLNYCATLLNGTSQKNKSKIFSYQKKAIRIITKSKHKDHTAPLFYTENILPYDQLLKYSSSMFMHSVYHKYGPKSCNNMFVPNTQPENHNLRTDNLKHFDLPFPRTDKFKKSPSYLLSEIWNSNDINKIQPNRYTYGQYLKNQLLRVQAT